MRGSGLLLSLLRQSFVRFLHPGGSVRAGRCRGSCVRHPAFEVDGHFMNAGFVQDSQCYGGIGETPRNG